MVPLQNPDMLMHVNNFYDKRMNFISRKYENFCGSIQSLLQQGTQTDALILTATLLANSSSD